MSWQAIVTMRSPCTIVVMLVKIASFKFFAHQDIVNGDKIWLFMGGIAHLAIRIEINAKDYIRTEFRSVNLKLKAVQESQDKALRQDSCVNPQSVGNNDLNSAPLCLSL